MRIGDLMNESGVGFGTSGARGLATAMTDRICYAYTSGFLDYLKTIGVSVQGQAVGIAGDLRPSSPRIMNACAQAIVAHGGRPQNLGFIPSPALVAYGMARGIPTLMVTGSHIPDDRNGIKFNLPTGEILKRDEDGIRLQEVRLPAGLFDVAGSLSAPCDRALPAPDPVAYREYLDRYLKFFPAGCLETLRVGVYEHSSVASNAYVAVLGGLGAQVTRLGYSEVFIPVDTEAVRPEDITLAHDWTASGAFDALVSADGDGDRPLIADASGRWLRGDIAGVLTARQLGARGVATPVSSNTAVERCGDFASVRRTRIGSPFVIESMRQMIDAGLTPVVGYEANGGFLLGSDIVRAGRTLSALPTRDAMIVAVTILLAAVEQGKSLFALTEELPARFTHSDRLQAFPTEIAQARIAALYSGNFTQDQAAVETRFGAHFGEVAALDMTDGLRIVFASGEIAHLRPSGNAPELRAYTEADCPQRAAAMNRICMDILAGWRN